MPYARTGRTPLGRRGEGALAILSTLGLSLALIGCGSSGPSATPTAARHNQLTPAQAKPKVVADWTAFFSGKTPAKRKIELVQDGPAFAAVIKAQANSPTAEVVTAKVSKVSFNKALTQATVVYTILMNGKPALANQKGKAVLLKGTWKVGAQSFCSLLALEGSAKQVRACSAKT